MRQQQWAETAKEYAALPQLELVDSAAGPSATAVETEPRRSKFNKRVSMTSGHLSGWSGSLGKRIFDCICVLALAPVLIPAGLIIGLAVKLTSSGPVLFIQRRVGRYGKTFPILKFRTMEHIDTGAHHAVTTAVNQRFTPIGGFLRRWKLDEIPQLLNVLLGHMSLVGPRPKLPEHNRAAKRFACRPGITGAATIAFAREEAGLARVPAESLSWYYHEFVLPAKLRLDAEYMAEATFLSDLKLIVRSVLRHWDDSVWKTLPRFDEVVKERETLVLRKAAQPARRLSLAMSESAD